MSLVTQLSDLATRVATEVKALRTLINGNVADLSDLDTTATDNLVNAINEVYAGLGSGGAVVIDDLTDVVNTTPATGHIFRYDGSNYVNVLGTTYFQAQSAVLAALAALTNAANKGIQFTGSGNAATYDLTAFAKTILDDADAITARATLGLVIGTDVQGYTSVLAGTTASFTTADETKLDNIETLADVTDAGNVGAAIHGATAKTTPVANDEFGLIDSAASNVLKRMTWSNVLAAVVAAIVDSAPGTMDTLNELAAALGDDPNFATTITTALAGKQPLHAALTSIAGLTTLADRSIYTTASNTYAVYTLTSFARTILDDADAATVRGTISVYSQAEIGSPTTDFVAAFEAGLV